MEYYYTRRSFLTRNSTIRKLIALALILIAVMLSYSARANSAGCNLTASITSANVSCNGGNDGSATVMISGGTAPYSYVWNSSPVQTTATAIALEAGSYTVTVTDAMGCTAVVGVMITEPATALSLSMSSTPASCAGINGTATVTASGGTAPYSYSWITSPVQSSAVATGLAPGTYTVTVTDANGCMASDSVNVGGSLAVNAIITGPDTICQSQGYPKTYTLYASGGTSYFWSNGSTSYNALVTPTATTTYSVIASNGSCSDTAYFTLVVYKVPQAWVSGPSTACAGDSIALTAHDGMTFMWSTGQTSATVDVVPTANTTYTVIVANGICPDTVTHAVTVSTPGLAISGCATPCANMSGIEFRVDDSAGASAYTWTVPAGWSIVEGQNSSSIKVTTGDLSADGSVSVITSGACANANLSLDVNVSACTDDIFIPNTFTPNGDGFNDTWTIRNIKLYPGNEVVVLNRWGNEVYHANDYDNTWSGGELEAGTYFYSIKVKTSDHDEAGCATGELKETVYKGYVMIVREK
jgi:gliding motility-associated-like protein